MEKVGEEEAEVVDRIDSTTEEACLVHLVNLVDSDLEEVAVVLAVAAVEEVEAGEEEAGDAEAVTVAGAGLLLVIGAMEKGRGTGGELFRCGIYLQCG